MYKYDVIIIGGGICGLTAAIYAARSNFSVCILEKEICGGLVNSTYAVENIPSYKSINGMMFMQQCREQAEALGVVIFEIEEVVQVNLTDTLKQITTTEEQVFVAPAVIVATGRNPLPLPIQTDFSNVHYCSICDGTAYKNKDLIVVGGGNSGFDESLYLVGLGINSIMIVEKFPNCLAASSTQLQAVETGCIHVRAATEIQSVEPMQDGRATVTLKNTATDQIEVTHIDGIFCFIGQKPNSSIFTDILEMENGYINVSPDMETNLAGVFAAGDVTVKKYRQITTAMSDGTIAALQAGYFLRNNPS